MNSQKPSDLMRRDFVKKAAYIAPVILTLRAMPALAQVGSGAPVDTDIISTDLGPPPTEDLGPAPPDTVVPPGRTVIEGSPSATVSEGQTSSDWCEHVRGPEPSPRGPRGHEAWHLCD